MNAEQLDLWLALADRFGAAEMRDYRTENEERRTIHPQQRVQGRDFFRAERMATARADAEAEARKRKRATAIAEAVDGPAMIRVKRPTEARNPDCVKYSACLDSFVARYCQRGDANAECPTGCAHYQRERLVPLSRQHSSLHAGGEFVR